MRLNKLWLLFVVAFAGCGGVESEDQPASLSVKTSTNCETINDAINTPQNNPLFINSWHLNNSYSYKVLNVWKNGITGSCVKIAVVDSGVDLNHQDLNSNALITESYDYATNSNNTTAGDHATKTIGVISAASNALGGIGVAPNSKFLSLNILDRSTVSSIVDAMLGHQSFNSIDISNNSWGFTDNLGTFQKLGSVLTSALQRGVNEGRNGKGINYVTAAGNNWNLNIDSNLSQLTNNEYVIVVGGADKIGKHPNYAQGGATILVSGLTQGTELDGSGIVSTLPNNRYTVDYNGTSAAAPGVSGVVALMLQANPNLTWRQVRWILAETSDRNNWSHESWGNSKLGQGYSEIYGYGIPNAEKAVNKALNPPQLNQQKTCELSAEAIGGEYWFYATSCGIEKIEFVKLSSRVNGDLSQVNIAVVSPLGSKSILARSHTCRVGCYADEHWEFGSVRFMNENSSGVWKIQMSGVSLSDIKLILKGD